MGHDASAEGMAWVAAVRRHAMGEEEFDTRGHRVRAHASETVLRGMGTNKGWVRR